MKIVVYTAVLNDHDDLRGTLNMNAHGAGHFNDRFVRYVRFVDCPMRRPNFQGWENIVLPPSDHPRRAAKEMKILPHRFFPDADFSLWMDGSFSLNYAPAWLIEQGLQDADIALYPHPYRFETIYDEAQAVIDCGLDDPAIVRAQVQRYRELGFPKTGPLYFGGVILRRHSPAMTEFNEAWWHEIQTGSIRDQLSLPVLLWQRPHLKVRLMEPEDMPTSIDPKGGSQGNPMYSRRWVTFHNHAQKEAVCLLQSA